MQRLRESNIWPWTSTPHTGWHWKPTWLNKSVILWHGLLDGLAEVCCCLMSPHFRTHGNYYISISIVWLYSQQLKPSLQEPFKLFEGWIFHCSQTVGRVMFFLGGGGRGIAACDQEKNVGWNSDVGNNSRMLSYYQDYEDLRLVSVRQRKEKSRWCSWRNLKSVLWSKFRSSLKSHGRCYYLK